MQRATEREELETYGDSSPIIHSVSHNSVENQALKMPQGSCLVQLSVQNAVEIPVEGQENHRGLLNNRRITKGLMMLD
jgi:hypothetical protein